MRRNSMFLSLAGYIGLTVAAIAVAHWQARLPDAGAAAAVPKTKINVVVDEIQGHKIGDPYRWLEDQNSPETRAWINAQNAYTDSLLSQVPGRDALRQEVAAAEAAAEVGDNMGLPILRNGRYFFMKRPAGHEDQLYVRKGLNGADELLVDPMTLDPKGTTHAWLDAVSRDGSLIVYMLEGELGGRLSTPHLFDVDAHRNLPDKFPEDFYGRFSVLPDKTGLYYSKDTGEGQAMYFHKIGTSAHADLRIFEKRCRLETYAEGGKTFVKFEPCRLFMSSGLSEDGRYLWITAGKADAHEVYIQDLKSKGPIVPVVNDPSSEFFPVTAGDKMYLRTDWNAPKWRVMEVDLSNPKRDNWREIIPQGEGVLEDLSAIGGRLAVHIRENLVDRDKLYDTNGKLVREVEPPTLGSLSELDGTWESTEAFFYFRSFHIPGTVYRYDVATGGQSVRSQSGVPFQTDQYEVHQVWYASKDGTQIPMFLAHAKGLKLDGSHPTLLTGHHGLLTPLDFVSFDWMPALWMAHGGIYAVANLRGSGAFGGSGEFGEAWHRAGMLEKKQNAFDDFIAAGEWLVENKYTSPKRLAISGGLEVGAAFTQRPDLFAAVICDYPLLDMLRYHKFLKDPDLVSEYGSAEKPGQFDYIYAYSPYHRVKAGTKYPAVLFISGDSDTRVGTLHAGKMTALMQAATGSEKPILLHYHIKTRDSGEPPISEEIDDITDKLAFLMWQLKMTPTGQSASGHN